MKTHAKLIIGMLLAGSAFWMPAAADQTDDGEQDKAQVVRAYTDAFNRQDAEEMADLLHPDIQLMAMSGNGLEAISSGKKVMKTQMLDNFRTETPTTTSLSDIRETSSGVQVTETATWQGDDGKEKSQSISVLYTVTSDGLIRRIQYMEPQLTEP
ncbi:nuclear transport factor 2 family protein [Henriciella marina]|uniref:nuclear transport factor 2 family protein n=1 Tax=Henriciella marina TaxID=453851 RepID=UPI00037506D8|nr:nuclear transport factor 2 family protein [Henriciella marina]